jgi:hypothetical protein
MNVKENYEQLKLSGTYQLLISAGNDKLFSKNINTIKECSPKASQSISGVSVMDLPNFVRNMMQTHCLILPSIADKMNPKSKKHSFKNSICSQHGVMWQTDTIGFQKCDLGLPSQFLSPRQLLQTVQELSDTTSSLVVALCNKPEVTDSIPDEVIGFFD